MNFKEFLNEASLPKVIITKSKVDLYLRDNSEHEKFKAGKFARYVDEKELKQLMIKIYGHGIFKIEDIAQIAIDQKFLLKDGTIIKFLTNDVLKYREYNRKIHDEFSGSQSREDVQKLKNNIEKNGIKEPLIIHINIRDGKKAECYLGEGNHRIAIAEELGIMKVPVKFNYRK